MLARELPANSRGSRPMNPERTPRKTPTNKERTKSEQRETRPDSEPVKRLQSGLNPHRSRTNRALIGREAVRNPPKSDKSDTHKKGLKRRGSGENATNATHIKGGRTGREQAKNLTNLTPIKRGAASPPPWVTIRPEKHREKGCYFSLLLYLCGNQYLITNG